MTGPATPHLSRMLADCGVAATRILESQISTAINASPSADSAFEQMPVSLVCWYLGYRIATLTMLESVAADRELRTAESMLVAQVSSFLTNIATLNSRVQPELAEIAMASVDGFNDELMQRDMPEALRGEDLSYGGRLPAPLGSAA